MQQLKIRELLLLNLDWYLYFISIYKFQDSTRKVFWSSQLQKLMITQPICEQKWHYRWEDHGSRWMKICIVISTVWRQLDIHTSCKYFIYTLPKAQQLCSHGFTCAQRPDIHCRSAVLGEIERLLLVTARNFLLEQKILVGSLFDLFKWLTERRAVTITSYISRTLEKEL